MTQRNQILSITTLLEGWSKVVRIAYRQLRRDGTWQLQDRDLLDRGDGITVLLHDAARNTVLLLRQPRIIATLKNHANGETLEACNGQVHPGESPIACALREVEEETGHRLATLTPVAQVYASPGGSLEIIHLFLGHYSSATQITPPGGLAHEGEDIELVELPLASAYALIATGELRDARTILVLQHLYLAAAASSHT